MPKGNDIYTRFADRVGERRFIQPGDAVLAAVSGGADSTALLHLLARLRDDGWEFGLTAAHFNHRLRPEAAGEQRLVEHLCRELGVECRTGDSDIRQYATERELSVHQAARDLRYEFLTATAAGLPGARKLAATGHHRGDQVETILQRLLTGAGVEGLAGVRETVVWEARPEVTLVRPLLGFSRAELREYCHLQGLPFADDVSNDDPDFPRSRMRLELIPYLAQNFGTEALEAIARYGELAALTADLVDRDISAALKDSLRDGWGDEIVLAYDRFGSYLNILRLGMLLRAFRLLAGEGKRTSYERLKSADRHLVEGGEGAVQLGSGVTLERCGGRIHLWRESGWEVPTRLLPGESVEIPGFGRLETQIVTTDDLTLPPPPDTQYCALDALRGGTLTVRPSSPGDRLRALGHPGALKVTEALRQAGQPPARRCHPVVCDDEGIVAVPPLRIADRVKLTPDTRQALAIRLTDSAPLKIK